MLREGIERRLTDSLETALKLAEGVAEIELVPRDGELDDDGNPAGARAPHVQPAPGLPECGTSFEEPAPRNFSFNSPYGACEHCDGLGTTFEVDPELVVPNTDLSIERGRHRPVERGRARSTSPGCSKRSPRPTTSTSTRRGRSSPRSSSEILLYGVKGNVTVKYKNRYGRSRQYSTTYEGVIPFLQRRHSDAESDWSREQIESYMREVPVPALRRGPAQAGLARRHHQRPPHRRGLRPVDRRVVEVPRVRSS